MSNPATPATPTAPSASAAALGAINRDGLRIRDLTCTYDRRPAVHHVTCAFSAGSLVAVLGPNGAGKSTLLKAICGEHPISGGEVSLDGAPAIHQRRRLAWMSQRPTLSLEFPATVEEIVEMGRYARAGWWRGFTTEDRAAIDTAIAELGLGDVRRRPVRELSGGQLKRVLLARALATGADVVLLDEPFNDLDQPTSLDLLRRLERLRKAGKLVLCVVHDLALARRGFTHGLLLRNHLIAAGPIDQVLKPEHLDAAYQHGHESHGHSFADPEHPWRQDESPDLAHATPWQRPRRTTGGTP